MIWPVWVALSLCVVALTWRVDPRPAILLALGLLAMRLAPVLPYDLRLVASAGLWVAIGGVIVSTLHRPVVGSLVVASGLCYAWAWLTRAEIVAGSAPFVVSDILGASALIVLVWGARNGVFGTGADLGGIWALVRGSDRRGAGSVGRVAVDEKAAKGER